MLNNYLELDLIQPTVVENLGCRGHLADLENPRLDCSLYLAARLCLWSPFATYFESINSLANTVPTARKECLPAYLPVLVWLKCLIKSNWNNLAHLESLHRPLSFLQWKRKYLQFFHRWSPLHISSSCGEGMPNSTASSVVFKIKQVAWCCLRNWFNLVWLLVWQMPTLPSMRTNNLIQNALFPIPVGYVGGQCRLELLFLQLVDFLQLLLVALVFPSWQFFTVRHCSSHSQISFCLWHLLDILPFVWDSSATAALFLRIPLPITQDS